ncbi:MAG: SOS response-associated peptidase, partial [Patescibacteria group bacterium]
MCGRFAIVPTNMKARYGLANEIIDLVANYNASPGQYLPVITFKDSKNKLELMKWGLIPHWSKDDKIGYKMINARSETILEKPSYKKPFETSRCIIPISGFYEWKRLTESTTKTDQSNQFKPIKIPYFIKFKDKPVNSLISLAGIYATWTNPETKEAINAFSIITTKANKQMEAIHDRMPVILNQEEEHEYLNSEQKKAFSLLKPNNTNLDIHEVSREVNSPSNNYEGLLEG